MTKKKIESEKVWFIVGMIFFAATFPLCSWMSILSCFLGYISTLIAYYIAQKKNYETFYELYKKLGVKWRGGFTGMWNIKKVYIVGISIFFVSFVLAFVVNKFSLIGLFLTIALTDVWIVFVLSGYRAVDVYLRKKYEKMFDQE